MGEHSHMPRRVNGSVAAVWIRLWVVMCVFVFMRVSQLPRAVWSRCASASFTHSTGAHCLRSACAVLSQHPATRWFSPLVLCFFFSLHIVIFELWASCGSLWRKKVFLARVRVWEREAVCPLCLHLFIVCTHLAGDTWAPGVFAVMDG